MDTPASPAPPQPVPSLPYTDLKPVGAADFYAALNATFRFIARRLGQAALVRYWQELGQTYYAPVTRLWQQGGLPAVEKYWRDFFAAEPGAEVSIQLREREVELQVLTCPAIRYLREHGREIHPDFCQHCFHVGSAMGQGAGMDVRIQGGNGTCTQRYALQGDFSTSQNLSDIAPANGQGAV